MKILLASLVLAVAGCVVGGVVRPPGTEMIRIHQDKECYTQTQRENCQPGYKKVGIVTRYEQIGNLDVCCEK